MSLSAELKTVRSCKRLVASLAACLAISVGGLAAMSPASARGIEASEERVETRSLIGSYLAGRFAKSQNDITDAARFYGSALAYDAKNEVLLEQAFVMEASAGNWDRVTDLADQLVTHQPQNRLARLFLGLSAFKGGQYAKADAQFIAGGTGPIGELTTSLMRAWVKRAENQTDEALQLLEAPRQAEWAQFYLRYHRALIADSARRPADAKASYARVLKQDSRTLRTTLAYARHAVHWGDDKLAKSILREYMRKSTGAPHPLAKDLLAEIEAGKPVGLILSRPIDGMAEVLYGLGEALTTEGGVSIGIIYLQLALFLEPDQPLALAALAHAYETMRDFESALATYKRIPAGSPLQNAIDIRKAFNLNSLDKVDEAKAKLETVAARTPGDLAPLDALGNILRARKRYDEAIVFYSRAIDLIEKPERQHWSYFYSRGTCYERTKQWPKAEADLKRALALSPDQPLVLNYLGYSWIDQGKNLKQGLELIEKAVALKPDDGYIVDSLGWAHYRLGRYAEAVRHLERAVELRPDDPVLNDHLGDALWRVGRQREARFQWEQALSLGPEAEEIEKIKGKLANGLPSVTDARNNRKTRAASREVKRIRRVDSTTSSDTVR
ncbi:MAG: tetratricopeptide repeat protein [Hyphomicrobiaceae bacterium]